MRFLLLAALLVGEVRAADVDTRKFSGVVFDVATPGQEYASITWRSDAVKGRRLLGFTTSPDGARHTYWFDFTNRHNLKNKHTGEKSWSGMVHALTVEQVLSGKKLPIEKMRLVSGRPSLLPDIGVTYAGPESAIPRTGRPLALELILRNYGTEPARNVRFAFDGLPKDCRVLDKADLAPSGEIGECEGWDSVDDDWESGRLPNERRFRVTLSDPGAGRHVFGLVVSADGMASRRVSVTAEELPSLGLSKADRMPAPKPVKTGKYEIGAFIFPGWDTHLWHGVWSRAPHRKPVLGWYDETNPDVVDWQIKHLVENGVSFVFVDWYWRRGYHYHKHWPVAFGKARYRGLLKWSLMWANHHAPGAHSVADQEKVTRYWIDNYFRDPQYMQIDGKPVVSIWSADAMERDMGSGGWGEGSIGYPNRELGFGMLEALRDTFGEKPAEGWPLNYAPEDVGLGPYTRSDDTL